MTGSVYFATSKKGSAGTIVLFKPDTMPCS